jgi:hypothetical protein
MDKDDNSTETIKELENNEEERPIMFHEPYLVAKPHRNFLSNTFRMLTSFVPPLINSSTSYIKNGGQHPDWTLPYHVAVNTVSFY